MIYFAYGSLMNRSGLADLCPRAEPLRCARISDHRLAFTGSSSQWGGGSATIRLAPGRDVWGALYEVDEECRRAIERSGEADGYVWAWTQVMDEEGKRIRAGLLVKVRHLEAASPSPEYLDVLRQAWTQWGRAAEDFETGASSENE